MRQELTPLTISHLREKKKKNTSPTDLQVPPIFLQLKSSLFTPIALKGEAGASTVFIVYNYVSMNHDHESCDTPEHSHEDTQTQTRTQAQTHPCMIPMRACPHPYAKHMR